MEAIYIISTFECAKQNKYKPGYHTGTKKKLISRYATSLIHPIVYYFRYTSHAKQIESSLKSFFEKERIMNCNRKKTEWINIELDILIYELDKIFSKYEKNIKRNTKKYKQKNINIDKNDEQQEMKKIIHTNINHMGKFKCNRRPYETNNKHDFHDHINRKIPCNPFKLYTCERCNKKFYNETHLKDHMNRKIPCIKIPIDNKEVNNYCEKCNKYFSRPYTLNRHIRTIHDKNKTPNFNKINTNNGNNNQIINTGDNNKIIVKQYNIYPFGKYELDDLSTTEKIAIFSSNLNPIEMIVIKTHLNPDKTQYHNCGFDDLHSGYGIIYDGEKWEHWRISLIMNSLIEIGQENSLKLYEKIKHFFIDDAKKSIEYSLDSNKYLTRPRNDHFNIDISCKKNLIAHIKTKFYDKCYLVEEAMKNSGKPIIKLKKDNTNNILKEGITIEDVDNFFKEEEKIKLRVDNLRQMCNQLLFSIGDKINELDKKMIADYIDTVSDINIFNTILNLLTTKYFFGKTITYKLLMNKINLNNEMNNYIK